MANETPFDKPYSLVGAPTDQAIYKIDEMLEQIYQRLSTVQTTVNQALPPGEDINLSQWKVGKAGPWTFDDIHPSTARAVIAPTALAASTEYTDFAPEGIDECIEIHLTLAGTGASISGIRQFGRISRKVAIVNNDATNNVTITHAGSNSTARYRFALPNDTDVELSPYQIAWMSYNTDLQRWQLMITPHASGGLGTGVTTVGAFTIARLSLSEAQMEALGTGTPQTIVAAPGAGLGVYPLWLHFHMTIASGYGASPGLTVTHTGVGVVHITATSVGWGSAAHRQGYGVPANFNNSSSVDNLPLQVQLNADPGASGTLTGDFVINMAYITVTL